MIFLGVDPGKTGAMCLLNTVDNSTVFVDYKSGFREYIKKLKETKHLLNYGAIEKVHSMSKQGVKSMFSFGQRLGELEGVLQTLDISYDLVPPRNWQKVCGIPPNSTKSDIYDVMIKKYPTAGLKNARGTLLDGRSDSLGIAHYLRITYSS